MDENFNIGKSYAFEVKYFQSNSYGNYIYLRRGDRETYRVKSYPFQDEDPEKFVGKTIYCIVSSINPMNGLPVLRQDKSAILKENYQVNEEFLLKITDILVDDKSGASYYVLSDEFGLEHRCYFKGEHKYGRSDMVRFNVDKIDDDKGILVLSDKSQTPRVVQHNANHTYAEVTETTEFGVEDIHTEFKTSIVFTPGDNAPDIDRQLTKIIRVISSFMNVDGGILWLGVNDSGTVTGIENDFQYLATGDDEYNASYKNTTDSYQLKIKNTINRYCGNAAGTKVNFKFYYNSETQLYCAIEVQRSNTPVFMHGTALYLRSANQTIQLKGDEITNYIKERCSDEIRGIIGEHIQSKFKAEINNNPISENKEVKPFAPVKSQIPNSTDEVWYYFTFYKDGNYSLQKNTVLNDSVEYELPVMKSQKDYRMMMCYDNGCINVVIPSKVRYKKVLGRLYPRGWNTDSKILNIFVTAPYNLIVAYSTDKEGVHRVKAHSVTDFNPVESIKGKGSLIVNPIYGKVNQYKLVQIENKVAIPGLIMEKRFTSQLLGFRVSDPALKQEIEFLNNL